MDLKKNISLIVGIAIPILMIVLTTISIYLPSFFAPAPQFNFLYVVNDNYRSFVVENGLLVKREVKYPSYYTPKPVRLFIHDVKKNTSLEITFEDAQKLKLDPRLKSPDGYEVAYGVAYSDTEYVFIGFIPFIFGERDYDTMYLKGHNTYKRLNLEDGKYYWNQRFLGWIIE